MKAKLISIIGPMAVGKTTLAECLASDLSARLILEDFEGNPFLTENYDGFSELTLPCQLYFMMSRIKQLSEETWPDEGVAVSDYGFCQDRLYAEAKLEDDDRLFYEHICRQVEWLVHPPSVLIHVDAPTEVLMERIAERGREFEQIYTPDFIDTMREAHFTVEPPEGCLLIRTSSHDNDFRTDTARAGLLETLWEHLAR